MNYLKSGGSWVKIGKYRNQLLIIMLAVGFFVGVLYQNVVAKQFGVSIQIFQSYFLKQERININKDDGL